MFFLKKSEKKQLISDLRLELASIKQYFKGKGDTKRIEQCVKILQKLRKLRTLF